MLKHALVGAVAVLGFSSQPALSQAQSPAAVPEDDAVFLVATPRLVDPAYRQTVLLVVPAENDRHIGFIINRPTQRSLSSLFPEHEPSKKVVDPVYFGGPMSRSALFAVVKSEANPGGGSIGLMKNLFFAMRVDVVDKIIENTPNEARYYVGYVEWRPGELRTELNRGLWSVANANMERVFSKDPATMWEEMYRLSRAVSANAAPLIDARPVTMQLAAAAF
jgi:putative transcriptional regulator